MIKDGEVNLLNIFGLREIKHCPPHFQKVIFTLCVDRNDIKNWVYEHLSGRFWIGDFMSNTETEKWSLDFCVAFEDPQEATYFGLLLDQVNKWDYKK